MKVFQIWKCVLISKKKRNEAKILVKTLDKYISAKKQFTSENELLIGTKITIFLY